MRLAIISTMDGWSWGGSEELWALVADEALQRGDVVLLAVHEAMRQAAQVDALKGRGAALDLRHGGLLARRMDRLRELAGPRASWRLSPLRTVLTFQPDVVLLSEGSAFDVVRPGLVDDVTRIAKTVPLVWLSQLNLEGAHDAFVRERAPELIDAARSVVFVAERNRANAARQLAHPLMGSVIIQNPLVVDNRVALPWPTDDTARLAVVARLDVAYKGHDVVLEALASPPWRNRPWTLTLVGSGHDHGYLQRLVKMFQLEDRVRFVGQIADVPGLWRSHHLLVLGSRAEGTPLAMLEAMACGRPVVATDVGGVAEWLRDGLDGFVAEAPTVAAIARALERAWRERSDWEAMGARARERFDTLHDPAPQRTLLRIIDKSRSAST